MIAIQYENHDANLSFSLNRKPIRYDFHTVMTPTRSTSSPVHLFAISGKRKRGEKKIFKKNCLWDEVATRFIFFSTCVSFHEYSRLSGQQGKKEGYFYNSSLPLPFISPISPITAESLPLYKVSSRTPSLNPWFPSASP